MRLPITIQNCSQTLANLLAVYSVHLGLATLSFTFNDVIASVTEEDGERLSGTFTSSRDSGTYEATLHRKRRRDDADSSNIVYYQGHWRNDAGRTGYFSIEWARPGSAIRSMDADMGIMSLGSHEEPVFLVRDQLLYADHGTTVQNLFLESLGQIPKPEPQGSEVWRSWKKAPEGCGDRVRVRALEPMADFILSQFLRVMFSDVWHVMTPDRGYDSKDVNVYSVGGDIGWHKDAQPYGSLVFVFCAGLACMSSVSLKNGEKRHLEMRSGDCMVFEGKTWHTVHRCIQGQSPFGRGEWLADRRLSILVRQKPPARWMNVPH